MRNLLIGLTVVLLGTGYLAAGAVYDAHNADKVDTTPESHGTLDHWTCTNDDTLMFMVLNTSDMTFHMWDSTGRFILNSKFTKKSKTEDGTSVQIADIPNGGIVWITAPAENVLNLGIKAMGGDTPALFVCV